MAAMNRMADEWQSDAFRMSMVRKLQEAIQEYGLQGQKDPQSMENQIFLRAKDRTDYLNTIARFILMIQKGSVSGQPESNTGMLQSAQGGSVPTTVTVVPGAMNNQIQQQAQGVGIAGAGNNTNSGNIPQFPVLPQQLQATGQQQTPQQQIMLQQQQHQQIAMNQQMTRSQLQHRLGQGMQVRIQGQPGMPGMMPTGVMVTGNRMSMPQHAATSITTTRNPSMMSVAGAPQIPPPIYQGGPSPGMAQQVSGPAGTTVMQQPGPSPGGTVTGFIQSPASNQNMMSPSPMGGQQGPRSVGSPMGMSMVGGPMSNQSIATPQQGESVHDQRQDEQAYLEKVKQLGKYIEPLRRMIARIGNEDQEKLGKMNKLMDILSNPNKRMPMETLLKCEAVLEKMNLDTGSHSTPSTILAGTGGAGGPNYTIPSPSASGMNPILDAVIKLIGAQQKATGTQSSPLPLNHTLHRTFAPLEAIFGPEISVPSISEIRKSCSYYPENETTYDIPDVIQGEVARLQPHFKVSLDPAQPDQNFSETYTICQLEDRDLPSVPPLNITIPRNYPESASPICSELIDYDLTPFLKKVKDALMARMAKLPQRHSLSQLLSAWEMSVRAACSLRQLPVSNTKA